MAADRGQSVRVSAETGAINPAAKPVRLDQETCQDRRVEVSKSHPVAPAAGPEVMGVDELLVVSLFGDRENRLP